MYRLLIGLVLALVAGQAPPSADPSNSTRILTDGDILCQTFFEKSKPSYLTNWCERSNGSFINGPCSKKNPWRGVTCDLKSGRVTQIDLNCKGRRELFENEHLPTSIGGLVALTYLNLSYTGLQGTLPSGLGLLINLEILDLSSNSFVGEIPVTLASSKSQLRYLDLNNNNLNPNIPCSFDQKRSLLFNFDSEYFCFPLCLTRAAILQQKSCLNAFGDYDDDYYLNPYCPVPCDDNRCKKTEYVDMNSPQENATCISCEAGAVSRFVFSDNSSDCVNIVTNMTLAFSVLILCVAMIIAYIYYGRIHWVAFLRMERLVLVLINMYSVTIKALIGLRNSIRKSKQKQGSNASTAAADPVLKEEQAVHRKNVCLFWFLVVMILLIVPFARYVMQMWSTFLYTLILWNSWNRSIASYTETIDDAIGAIAENDFVRALFEPGRRLLEELSKIKLDFALVKIFKLNVFKNSLDIFKTVISSRGYRKFIKEDSRFDWSWWKYLKFLAYSGLAELVAALLDFPNILRFFLAQLRYDSVSLFINRKSLLHDDRCNYAEGLIGADYALLVSTSIFSIFMLLPFFYEVGKVLVPGNRLPSSFNKALLRVAPRSNNWQVPLWTVGPRQWLDRLLNKGMWLFSFVAIDVWLAFLAEKWLSVVHLAIPPSSLPQVGDEIAAPSRGKASKADADADADTDENPSVPADPLDKSDKIVKINKRSSLGWSAIMESIRTSESHSQNETPEKDIDIIKGIGNTSRATRLCDWGVCHQTSPFMRIYAEKTYPSTSKASEGHEDILPAMASVKVATGQSATAASKYVGDRTPKGMPHGHGRCDWGGNVYLGQWSNGHIEGSGTFRNKDGALKQGQFREINGQWGLDGVGLSKNADGEVFFGHWKSNRRHGFVIFIKGNEVYTALWDHDKEIPKSRDHTLSQHNQFYDGPRNAKGKFHGKGMHTAWWQWPGVELYFGDFCEGLRHGEGMCVFLDGSFYNGGWFRGKRQGFGTLTMIGGSYYYGHWESDMKNGPGSIINAYGEVIIGVWTKDSRNLETRFALQPARDVKEEEVRWAKFLSEHSLPTYSELVSFEYRRFMLLLGPCRIVSSGLILCGAGISSLLLLRVRLIWRHIFQNYFIFISSALGVWTKQGREVFNVEECIKATDAEGAESGTEAEQPELISKKSNLATRWAKYTNAWNSIIAPRCMLFMVVPYLTPVMLWTTLMVNCPLYIADPDVPFPGWFDLQTYRERSRHEIDSGSDQQWMVWLDALHLYAKEGRLVQTVVNALFFYLATTLWMDSNFKLVRLKLFDGPRLKIEWAYLSLVVLIPYNILMSLRLVIYIGKALDIKDADVGFKISNPSHEPRRNVTHQDEIPKQQQRQSLLLDFGSTYPSSPELRYFNEQGDMELVEQTVSPLPAAATAPTLRVSQRDNSEAPRLTPGPYCPY